MNAAPRVVLGLFAHPDDETFGPGATLARLAGEGHAVHQVTATRGEAGTIGGSALLGRRALAATRTREMRDAAAALGMNPPEVLSLPDSGLRRLGEPTLLRPFVRAIRALRPDILLTFHDNGISGHADHRTVTARARTAFDAGADPACWPELGPAHAPERLWLYCVPESRARRLREVRKLQSVPDEAVDAVLAVGPWVAAKHRAVAAHASQKPFIDRLVAMLGDIDDHWSQEAFVLGAARTPLPEERPRPVDDLFAGLEVRSPASGR